MDAVIFGDVAGNYDALMRLVAKCPNRTPISVGDMIDRGPKSLEVLKFFREHGKAIRGNHEDFMIDYYKGVKYESGIWTEHNGGQATRRQFKGKESLFQLWQIWLKCLPLYIEDDELVITHAPIAPGLTLAQAAAYANCSFIRDETESSLADDSLIWSRQDPIPRSKYQIFGHNGYLKRYEQNDKEFAICIDSTRSGFLSALVLPERRVVVEKI